MKDIFGDSLAFLLALLVAEPALADGEEPGEWSGDITLASDYAIKNFTLLAQYMNTNADRAWCADSCDARGILSISRSF